MQVHEEETGGRKSNEPIRNKEIPVIKLEGHAYKVLKALLPYDTTMPRQLQERLENTYIWVSVLATPRLTSYIIKVLENELKTQKLFYLSKKSTIKTLVWLYEIEIKNGIY